MNNDYINIIMYDIECSDIDCLMDERIRSILKRYIFNYAKSKLTFRQRDCFIKYFYENKLTNDIAKEMKLTQPTVSRHLNAAKKGINNMLSSSLFLCQSIYNLYDMKRGD